MFVSVDVFVLCFVVFVVVVVVVVVVVIVGGFVNIGGFVVVWCGIQVGDQHDVHVYKWVWARC